MGEEGCVGMVMGVHFAFYIVFLVFLLVLILQRQKLEVADESKLKHLILRVRV